jgi:hypothetical protein
VNQIYFIFAPENPLKIRIAFGGLTGTRPDLFHEQLILMKKILFALTFLFCVFNAQAQLNIVQNGDCYLSWGYNHEWYTLSDIHIVQKDLNNDFTYKAVHASDHAGWDNNLLHKDLTIPQYNYRLGYFFNEKQDLGFEINFDHTKYVLNYGQDLHMQGTINGRHVDTVAIANEKYLLWMLNNGANFLQFNLLKKVRFFNLFKEHIVLDGLLKAGVGPVIPHVENTVLGHDNVPHFQFGGWNVDLDMSLRATFFHHIFLEFQSKWVYARYFGLRIYDGVANQAFGCYEVALVAGATFKLHK